MAANEECSEDTRVLLVDPQSLPVILRNDPEENDISVDLLEQALQGTSAIDHVADVGSAEEVSLDTLSNGNNDLVAIYQGEGGQTHTIKISLAEAESLGLHFTNTNNGFPVSLGSDSLVGGLKMTSVADHLTASNNINNDTVPLNSTNILQSMSCSNVASENRMIDEDGNIIETSEALQILPSSLTALFDEGMNQSLLIIPQYELDGTVTYAVKLKDPNDTASGTDYHVLEPNSSAKTGLDIEEELRNANMKQNILHSAETIALGTALNLNEPSSASIQVPVTLEALSKQMLLPVSSSPIPISVTLSTDSVSSSSSSSSMSSNVTAAGAGRYFHILSDHSTTVPTNAASATLTSVMPQSVISSDQQHPQLINPSSALLSIQNSSPVTLLSSNKNITQSGLRHQILSPKFSGLLSPSIKSVPITALKTPATSKKVPIATDVTTPVTSTFNSVLVPAMASVAPNTTQPNIGAASSSKCATLASGRVSVPSSNSTKPLGSSENPIQLVQQGQTFHSMQALSQAHLRQIATVFQQKNLNSNSSATKNVLIDKQTKTRIVYRVVCPEDVDLQQPSSPSEKTGISATLSAKAQAKSRKGRPKRKKLVKQPVVEESIQTVDLGAASASQDLQSFQLTDFKNTDDGEKDTSQVDETPKVEKKKILGSRTRSGRVSRPPKHMMKDFKHLHHTDYKEKGDDVLNGGYSDYTTPEQPPDIPAPQEVAVDISPAKKRMSRFSCPTCNKLYLGLGRMEKHFLQYPDHGSFEEFKEMLSTSVSADSNKSKEGSGEKDLKASGSKSSYSKGKKRSQGFNQSEKERSEIRKKKLKQALEACEISEVVEVAGPLIARYYSLWDLLMLRLLSKDDSMIENSQSNQNIQNLKSSTEESRESMGLHSLGLAPVSNLVNCPPNTSAVRANSNRVQWLLMELSSLADTLQSMAAELFQPALMHSGEKTQIEIKEKTISNLFGVSCGIYSVNEQSLSQRIEGFATGLRNKIITDVDDNPPQKKDRKGINFENSNSILNHKDTEVCSESLSNLSLMVKPGDAEKVMLDKFNEDMPFLNSSDDMICGSEDPELSADSKRDPDCDSAAGMQVVDDIVNERLKNLSENMNFSVELPGSLQTPDLNGEQSGLHLMSSFSNSEPPVSVSNSSVIENGLNEGKPSVNVTSMDLMSSYSISSLSSPVPGAHDVNISNSEPSNDLSSALEPVPSQSMLGSFSMGLATLSTFDSLQPQSSSVAHSEDSFLESLSSFETPLTQTCSTSTIPSTSFDDSVMTSSGILQLDNQSSGPSTLPPKFISSFTPAVTSDKASDSISTAQRLQRTYLELESGLDDGLDLDFEALTEELTMNRNSSS